MLLDVKKVFSFVGLMIGGVLLELVFVVVSLVCSCINSLISFECFGMCMESCLVLVMVGRGCEILSSMFRVVG